MERQQLQSRKMLVIYRVCVFIFSFCTTFLAGNANAESTSTSKWQPYIDLQGKVGNERSLGRASLFLPLTQGNNQLLFADARFIFDDSSATEGNLGLAYRHRFGDVVRGGIFGVYGFIDYRKSENDFGYKQLTGGLEWLANDWEVRANIYAPEDNKNPIISSFTNDVVLNGTTAVYRSGTLSFLEQALPGYNVEAGYRFGINDRSNVWLHAGYFNFDDAGVAEVSGPRVRLEYRLQDPFGWNGSELGLGLEAQDDDVRGSQGFATARLRIPLGKVNKGKSALIGLDRRMVNPIQRDVDVVTAVNDTPIEEITSETPITDPDSGEVINVYFVDESGAGDCTQANPCMVGAAQGDAVYGIADIIVPLADSGDISSDILLTQPRQQVVGGGDTGSAVLSLSSGDQLVISDLGARPRLGATLSMSDSSFVAGFDIDHGNVAAAISANGITNATVRDVNVLGSGGAGFEFVNTGGAITIENSSSTNATGAGLLISGGDATVVLNNFDISDTASGRSVDIQNTTGGSIFFDAASSINNNGGSGLFINNVGGNIRFDGAVTVNGAINTAVTATNLNGNTLAFNGTTNIDNAAQVGIDIRGTSGVLNLGDVDITNFGGSVGVWAENASADVTFASLDINGTGAAGSRGVDITGSTGSLVVTNGGVFQDLETGFELDNLGTGTTNSSLSFQNGNINAGVPVNTIGITAGSYDFTGTAMIKNNALSTATGFGGDFWFADATGGGTGTSTDRASINFVESNSANNDIIVLVDDGTGNIIATNGLQLKNSQQLIGFAAGDATVDFTGSNANVLGTFTYQISDPTGNGAVTLSNSGGFEVVTLANANKVRDFNLNTSGALDAIAGSGFNDTTLTNLHINNAGARAFNFTIAGGTIAITDSSATNATGAGLRISGGDATVALTNFDISDTASGRSVDIQSTTGGSVSFDAASDINNSGGFGMLVDNVGGDITFNGVVNITGATSNALTATNLNANTVAFNGALDITTTNGAGLTSSNGTLNIAGTGTSIDAVNGSALDLNNVNVGNGSGGALTFTSLASNGGANGISLNSITAANGLTVNSATLANNTTAGININGVSGSLNITAANIDAAVTATGVAVSGANDTINIGTGGTGLDIDGGTTGVSINQSAGTVNMGSGASGVIAVDGASGAGLTIAGGGTVNIGTGGGSASIGATTLATGTAISVTGGNASVSYSGTINNTAGRLLDVQNTSGGSVTVTGGVISDSGSGIQVQNAAGNVSITNASTTSVTLDSNSGDFTMTGGIVSNSTVAGVAAQIDNTSGTVSFNNTDLSQANGRLIDIGATTGPTAGSITFTGNMSGTSGTGIRVQNTAANVSIEGVTLMSSTANAVTLSNNTGSFTLSNSNILLTTGSGILATDTSDLTFDTVSIQNSSATGMLVNLTDGSDANVTVSNSVFSSNGSNDGLSVITSNAGSEACLAASGNTFNLGDQLTLTETAGTLRVPGVANAAALSTANGGVIVNTNGSVGYGETCTIP